MVELRINLPAWKVHRNLHMAPMICSLSWGRRVWEMFSSPIFMVPSDGESRNPRNPGLAGQSTTNRAIGDFGRVPAECKRRLRGYSCNACIYRLLLLEFKLCYLWFLYMILETSVSLTFFHAILFWRIIFCLTGLVRRIREHRRHVEKHYNGKQ